MTRFVRASLKWIRALPQRLRRNRPHQEIVLLSTQVEVSERVVERLQSAQIRSAHLIHSVDSDGGHSTGKEDPEGRMTEAREGEVLHVSPWRKRRRRWCLHRPPWKQIRAVGDRPRWSTDTHTALLLWPYEALGGTLEDHVEATYRLVSALGASVYHGRCRRAAVVIDGVPAGTGLRHPSQTRIDIESGEDLHHELDRRLVDERSRPGSPLADSRWNDFLRRRVGPSPILRQLLAGAERAVGRACPIFFVAAESSSAVDTRSIVQWIAKEPEDFVAPTRATRVLTWGLGVGLCLSIILAATLQWGSPSAMLRPEGPGSNVLASHEASARIRARLADRDSWPLSWFRQTKPQVAANAALENALVRLETIPMPPEALAPEPTLSSHELSLQFTAWCDSLHRDHASSIDLARNARGPGQRDVLRRTLGEQVTHHAAHLAYYADHPELGPEREPALEAARNDLGRMALLWVLGDVECSLAPPARIRPRDRSQEAACEQLQIASAAAHLESVRSLLEPNTPSEFVGVAQASLERAQGKDRVAWKAGLRLVPAFHVRPRLDRAAKLSRAQRVRERVPLRRELEEILSLEALTLAERRLLSPRDADQARTRLAELDDLERRQPMTIIFGPREDPRWHVDASLDEHGSFRGGGVTPDLPGYRVLYLTATPIDTCYVRLNPLTSTHLERGMCNASTPVPLELWLEHARLEFDDVALEVLIVPDHVQVQNLSSMLGR